MEWWCLLRGPPGVPGSLHSWLGQGLRWERSSSAILPLPAPSPRHSSRQAAIGLLLHDCPLHRVPETLLPAAIFKIPPAQPRSLSPYSDCSSFYCSVPEAATTQQAGAWVPGAMGKGGPIPRVEPGVLPNPLRPRLWSLVLVQPRERSSSWGQACQGRWAHTCKHNWWVLAYLPATSAAKTRMPPPLLSLPTPYLTIPVTPGVGRQLGPASACGSPGHMKQAGDRFTEFFKALMEPAS